MFSNHSIADGEILQPAETSWIPTQLAQLAADSWSFWPLALANRRKENPCVHVLHMCSFALQEMLVLHQESGSGIGI